MPHRIIMDNVEIEECCAISSFVTIGSDDKIGINFHANLYSYVEHNCIIGNYITLASEVKYNGNIRIADHVYIVVGNPAKKLIKLKLYKDEKC